MAIENDIQLIRKSMAIWQFNIYFIPRKSLLNKYGQVPTQLVMNNKERWNDYIQNSDLEEEPSFEDALSIHWWLDLNISFDNLSPLLKSFGDIQTWTQNTEGLRSYGDTEANDISVCFDNVTNIVEEVSCRLDLRYLDKSFIDKVLSLAIQFDCLLMDTQGGLYQPTLTALFETIKLSNAYRFVGDPEQFLNDLSKGIVTPE